MPYDFDIWGVLYLFDVSHQRVFQTFRPGEYSNAASMKFVLKKASAVQKIGC